MEQVGRICAVGRSRQARRSHKGRSKSTKIRTPSGATRRPEALMALGAWAPASYTVVVSRNSPSPRPQRPKRSSHASHGDGGRDALAAGLVVAGLGLLVGAAIAAQGTDRQA